MVVDISEKTDDFVKSGLTAWEIIRDYYAGFIPRIDAMLFPLFTFISVIFFTSKMAGRSEIIAILSSGISFRRFMRPYYVGGIILGALLWLGYQWVVPRANRKWGDFEKTYIDVNSSTNTNSSYKQNIYFRLDSNSYAGIKGYDTITKSGNHLFIQEFRNNRMVYNLRASSFSWVDSIGRWKLNNALERKINDRNEEVKLSPVLLKAINFTPTQLRTDDYLKDQMTTPVLNDFIQRERLRGSENLSSLLVERYNRDAIPVSVLILTIIGAVLASRKVRGGSGAHLAIGVVISVTYVLFGRLSVVFATKGDFPPWLAAWTPNILFGLLAIYLYRRAPK